MAAYSAVASLMQILDPDQFPHHRNPKIGSLYDKLFALQSTLENILPVTKSIRDEVNDLDIQIRDAIYIAQDKIESFIFRQEIQKSSATFLEEIIADIDPLFQNAEEIADSIERPHGYSSSENAQTAETRSANRITKIVGQEEDLKKVKSVIFNNTSELIVVPIIGLPGIGKTTLAQSIYNDRHIRNNFSIRAWVTVTQDYRFEEIYSSLLSSMEKIGEKAANDVTIKGNMSELAQRLYKKLQEGRYLIVVDDIWDEDFWDEVKFSFPNSDNNSRIIVTSRLKDIAYSASFNQSPPDFIHVMEPLNDENSWMLLRQTVFRDNPCPSHLRDIGLEIAKNCRGLPLSLTVVGGLLFAVGDKAKDYWESIEEDTHDAASKGDQSYLEILSLSYNHLPRTLKACFLYLGAFPEDSEILVSKLVNLWVAEGFLKPAAPPASVPPASPPPPPLQSAEEVAVDYLEKLIDRNLVQIRKFTSNRKIKSCGVHDSLRDLAVQECDKEKFFHSRKTYEQKSLQDPNTQRRLSIHRNIFMCMEEVQDSVKQITSARTLLYTDSHYHHHPLPFCLTFDLLRVLDAFTVYFIEFPIEIVELIHLRYLSLTYNGKLPATLSNLQKLEILMVRRHPKIIYLAMSFLPVEIWNMTQLRHLIFTESDLPRIFINNRARDDDSVLFANLQSLSNVSAASCTKEVLQNMPNLKKLAVWTKTPGPVDCLHYLDQLQHLQTFKFSILHPKPKQVPKPKITEFPKTLIKLKLSGCALPWDDMAVIGRLPCLEVLKLRDMAFKGEEWGVGEDEFRNLKFLLIEYTDLKVWEVEVSPFPKLQRLMLRYCYVLGDIPKYIRDIGCLELIELVECSPNAVCSAEEIIDFMEQNGYEHLKVRIYSSYE